VLSTSPRQETFFRLERGYPFALNIALTDSEDNPVDLTGASMFFDMDQPARLGGANVITMRAVVLTNPRTLGLGFFSLNGDDLDVAPGEYPFAFTLLADGGYGTVVIKGSIEIVANANQVALADFTSGGAPFSLGVKMLAQNRIVVKTNHLPSTVLEAYTDAAQTAASAAQISADQAAASAAAAEATADSIVGDVSAQVALAEAAAADAEAFNTSAATHSANASASAAGATASALAAAGDASDAEAFNTSAATHAANAAASAASADADAAAAAASAAEAAAQPDRRTFWLNEPDDLPETDIAVGDLAFKLNHTTGFVEVHICQDVGPPVPTWNTIGAYRFVPTGADPGEVLVADGASKAVWQTPATAGLATAAHDHDGDYIPTTADILDIVKITQAAYDALTPPVATTLYIIVD
jgi:hypothetical protein